MCKRAPACLAFWVINLSAGEGSVLPDGWLCIIIPAEAFALSAVTNTNLRSTDAPGIPPEVTS